MNTLTSKIFQLSAPYSNPYQGNAPRVLFVCSVGLLRSPTAAILAYEQYGWNTRSCGSDTCALIPLNVNLIFWADAIVFMNNENYLKATDTFKSSGYDTDIKERAFVLGIEDDYEYMDPKLQQVLKERIESLVKF